MAQHRKKSSLERRNGQLGPTQTRTDWKHAQKTTPSVRPGLEQTHFQLVQVAEGQWQCRP